MRKNYFADLPMNFKNKHHEALISVWWTATQIKRVSRELFDSFHISEAQFNILMILKHSQSPLSQKDISKKILVDKANVTGLIDKLESMNLIKRNEVEGDRRIYHITLTNEGRKFINTIDKAYFNKVMKIMDSLTDRDAVELTYLTQKIRKGIAES